MIGWHYKWSDGSMVGRMVGGLYGCPFPPPTGVLQYIWPREKSVEPRLNPFIPGFSSSSHFRHFTSNIKMEI